MTQNNIESITIEQAPACYGAISCFAKDSEHCKRCVAYVSCEEQSYQTLVAIKNVVNVDDLLRKHEKARLVQKAKRDKLRAEMNVKAEQTAYTKPKTPEIVQRATKQEKVVFEITEQDEAIIMSLPIKAQPFALTLIKSGMMEEIKAGVKEGVNKISRKKPVWLAKTVDLLLDGGFTKAELKTYLVLQLNWSDNSAGAHVSLGIALLCGFGIAQEESGRVVAVP